MEGLARTLARAIADQGAALPGRHFREEMMAEQHEQNLEYHGRSDVYLILRALVVIVGSSSARARRLNNSSIIINTFNANWASKLSSNAISVGCLIPKAPRLIARLRELRQPPPHLHIQHPYVDPALLQNHPYKSGRYLDDAEEVGQNDEESPLIPYLIWLCRSDRSVERLAAAQLLAVLFKTGILDPGRQTDIGLIVIPIIAQQLLDFGGLNQKDAEGFFLMEEAPSILAKLMVDSEYLQKAAYDAGAVSSLFAILKYSYDPISPNLASWTPVNRDSPKMNSSDVEADRIGERIASLLHHCLKIRENVLKAIASCTPLKEEYRKSLVEQGITPLIVESLKPTLDKPLVDVADKRRSAKAEDLRSLSELNQSAISNSASALVAACSTVKHLARSPSLLRTALVDHGVVVPIFNLLGHPETEIQIAATAATINLVSELSPMREVSRIRHSRKVVLTPR